MTLLKRMKNKVFFDQELYSKVSVNDLIVFSMHSIENKQKECGFEDLVNECFNMFPSTFGFSKHPKWPDSRKLDRPLRDLRNKGIVRGELQNRFALTPKGKKKALEIVKTFRQTKLL